MRAIIILLLLVGCAEVKPGAVQQVEWRKLTDQRALNDVCDNRVQPTSLGGIMRMKPAIAVDGCFKREANTCVIYTLDSTNHDTLGHEVRHCFEGLFHQ